MSSYEHNLQKLKAEIAQERQMKEMLEQSANELQITVNELEKIPDSIGEENNEWRTRYEMQVELDEQLEKQIQALAEKVEDARETYNKSKLPKSNRGQGDANEATPYYVKQLDKEKNSLAGQLRDLEWRLDQESKAYHKANEERKQHLMEINASKGAIDHTWRKSLGTDTPRGGGNVNIPQDHRILDARYGPIKKTAAAKRLPHLN